MSILIKVQLYRNHMIARRQLAEFLVEHLSNSLAKLIKTLSFARHGWYLVHTVAKIHPPRRYAYASAKPA